MTTVAAAELAAAGRDGGLAVHPRQPPVPGGRPTESKRGRRIRDAVGTLPAHRQRAPAEPESDVPGPARSLRLGQQLPGPARTGCTERSGCRPGSSRRRFPHTGPRSAHARLPAADAAAPRRRRTRPAELPSSSRSSARDELRTGPTTGGNATGEYRKYPAEPAFNRQQVHNIGFAASRSAAAPERHCRS